MNPSGIAAALQGRDHLVAPGVKPSLSDKERAVLVARVLLKASNIDQNSDIALLAREYLRVLGLTL